MPLVALDIINNRITYQEGVKGNEYFCQSCKSSMIFKSGLIKIHHFSHKVNVDNCINKPESEEHLNMKKYIANLLGNTELEVMIDDTIFDVKKDNMVVECQVSPISMIEFNQRNKTAAKNNLKLTWVLGKSYYCKFKKVGKGIFLKTKEIEQRLSPILYQKDNYIDGLILTERKYSSGRNKFCSTLWFTKETTREEILNTFEFGNVVVWDQ